MWTRPIEWARARLRNKRLVIALEVVAVTVLLGALAWAVRDVWSDAAPRLRHANLVDLGLAIAALSAYYLVFVLGWMRILLAYGIRIPYRVALQAEMVSMLAKYVPGGVFTPAARVLVLRRLGIKETPVVLASILLEAGFSALAGVGVFVVGIAFIDGVDAPVLPLLAFTLLVGFLLYPPVFKRVAARLLRPFGAEEVEAVPAHTAFGLLGFYALTWPLGGVALFFMLRSVGGEPDPASIPFLGGTSAIGAIVAVLAIFAPSGLGVREASMYGLLLAVVSEGVALGATVLNRLAITAVEAGLLVVGLVLLRNKPLPADSDVEVSDDGLTGTWDPIPTKGRS
ncbi:MAG: flippase-like domain-containing protein [Actinobacteria bacterium]|nr:flippase-like domain-containing protein [Actinomycetota bacterium]